MSLFQPIPNAGSAADTSRPLADRMRPRTLEDYVGQEHLIAPGKPLRTQIERDDTGSIIFWGPPGTGKTTLAKIIANVTKAEFIEFSAVLAGIKEIKQVMADAERARQYGTRTIVFIDEIHRFNKAQQDAFLPHVEKGNIRLIGATTENPSFEINSALLSRCRVYVLNPLTEDQIVLLLRRALTDEENGLGKMKQTATDDVLKKIASYTSGDARSAYNVLEVAAGLAKSPRPAKTAGHGAPQADFPPSRKEHEKDGATAPEEETSREITDEIVHDALQKRVLLYDKTGEEHYNLISALHKSVRDSDPDAALYWLGRMLEAGEDPLACAQRELREETGYSASRWDRLGAFHNAIGYSDEQIAVYLARDLRYAGASSTEPGEVLQVFSAPWRELLQWTTSGIVTDVKTIVGVHWLERFFARGTATSATDDARAGPTQGLPDGGSS